MKIIFPLLLLTVSAAASVPSATSEILEKHTIKAQEISGMSWRKDPVTKKTELVLVGDGKFVLYLVDWDSRKAGPKVREIDLKTVDPKFAKGKSEWESVYADSSGRVFILRENPAHVLILSPDLKKIESEFDLKVSPEFAKEISWQAEANSQGEGILPLKNGHILVIKEKRPLRILEFGPAGAKAQGYKAEFSIEHEGAFPLPKDAAQFELLAHWKFALEAEETLGDSSGINVDRKGNLYLLSDESGRISEIGSKLEVGAPLAFKKHWILPKGIVQPEGMVIDRDNRPIVAIDNKKAKDPNLFVLSPLN